MKKRSILMMILGISLFISCQEREVNEFENEVSGNEMRFDVMAGTRVAPAADFSTVFETGDAIGIFVVQRTNEEEQAYPRNEGNYAHNCKLVYQKDGTWKAATEADKIFFPLYDAPLDVYAYHPYRENADPTNLTFTIDTTQMTRGGYTRSDLMTARRAGVMNDNTPVALKFFHKLSLVQANVTGALNPRSVRITMKGIKSSVTLNLGKENQEEELTAVSEGTVNVAMFGETINTGGSPEYVLRAIVPAQNIAAGTECIVKQFVGLGYDKDTLCKAGTSLALEAGKVGKYSIALGNVAAPANHCFTTVRIPAGTFMMGSPEGETGRAATREQQHQVRLTSAFDMAAYAVTFKQFCDFANKATDLVETTKNPAGTKDRIVLKGGDRNVVYEQKSTWGMTYSTAEGKWQVAPEYEDLPVVNVTWYGADAYTGWVGGRLATEAEWEYACRAGTTTAFPFGGTITDAIVNFAGTIKRNTLMPVYSFAPNAWGLFHMPGNASEWCNDWMSNDYGGLTNVTDPVGPAYYKNPANAADPANVTRKVLRGGAYNMPSANSFRSACRSYADPAETGNNNGFRVVFDVN